MRNTILLLTILSFMSQVLPVDSAFKEICERPNGSCQIFCIESEIQSGNCLNGHPCCLPMGNLPLVDFTTPSKR
ncbi:beta-defensin 108B [Erinaceus europaeus]|uniref:Beta-defensin 108B n=1 Tax=Erinaceus europaeus TaxID=9365 RepID=A0A1S2ZCN9_ERIEU|nr:beta-defensin 108B [Erinaceus europaeus]